MLLTIYAKQTEKHQTILDQMYQLRARQFSERRGWRVVVKNGQERDHFDQQNPLYICVVSKKGKLLASLRLLPTNKPHMLSEVFPEVMGDKKIIRHHLVLESSRFCVDTEAAKFFGSEGINIVTSQLLSGLFTTANAIGIKDIISVYDIYVERVLRRAGCIFKRVGPVHKYDDLKTVAGLFNVSDNLGAEISKDINVLEKSHLDNLQPVHHIN
ncbi:acyl-homoserine-lactone synthase [Amylibacter sp. SFDW26]|uniref:acyl-homoserine-lactone synthase n=1 Tax=Amylibacter sp. SFDW26 TaxID=2652722 RepID=UPI0012620D04|nr:acyl-homoserine-lactone synthase [Amylibacter sp. SFDW26]KAB7613378.1 acyl-homoserine-lactone synthase [Amylibacter sp. SFDW26]